jgi:ABC-type phosphate/phosphonate transport system substrate-binding protein
MGSHRAALVLLSLAVASAGCGESAVAAVATPATSPDQPTFRSIVVDEEADAADGRLKRFLERAVAHGAQAGAGQQIVTFTRDKMSYDQIIRAFVEQRPSGGAVARITPYAYVAAEMLGAKLDILAVYKSRATGRTTYRAYFVVNKATFEQVRRDNGHSGDATLDDVRIYLDALKDGPARFVYHDRFSTSSYFLPSLYFKSHEIYAMNHSINEHLIPLRVEHLDRPSSSDLVAQVGNGLADLAAVWDGTKDKFETAAPDSERRRLYEKVLFIPIPTAVPNDFIVASGISDATKVLLQSAIGKSPAAGRPCSGAVKEPAAQSGSCPSDDFDSWYVWDSNDTEITDEAREALARLRQDARPQPSAVIVRVEGRGVLPTYVEAAKEAVRLSGTEFVLFDKDLHRRHDMTWLLESTHDGALTLKTRLDALRQEAMPLSISFADRDDLPQRIADLVRSRLNRIRYVWPYDQKNAVVLRDLDFTPNDRVTVQRITWLDPRRNDYVEEKSFAADFSSIDFSKLVLGDNMNLPKTERGEFNFDPLSNVAYRVIIAREPQAGWIWVALPYCFIGLLALAGLGLIVDLRRREPAPRGFQQTYQRMVDAYHAPWLTSEIEEGKIVWCNPGGLSDLVKELKAQGSFFDIVQAGGCDFNVGPIPFRFSLLMKLASRAISSRPQVVSGLHGVGDVGHATALDTLINFLARRRRLSGFVGFPEVAADESRRPAWPIQWEALNEITSRHFQQLGICDKRVDASFGATDSSLAPVVSTHFRSVVKKAMHDVSLFRQTWQVHAAGNAGRLACEAELRCALLLRDENGSTQVQRVRLEVHLPADAVLSCAAGEPTLQAWVFCKILGSAVEGGVLVLHLKPIAILNDHAD